jgi:hypothetical protein
LPSRFQPTESGRSWELGKVVHDADLARKYMALGVKMEERG